VGVGQLSRERHLIVTFYAVYRIGKFIAPLLAKPVNKL
jgi:hypothetical protein